MNVAEPVESFHLDWKPLTDNRESGYQTREEPRKAQPLDPDGPDALQLVAGIPPSASREYRGSSRLSKLVGPRPFGTLAKR